MAKEVLRFHSSEVKVQTSNWEHIFLKATFSLSNLNVDT